MRAARRSLVGLGLGLGGCWTVPAEDVHPAGHAQEALRSSMIRPLAEVHVRGRGAVAVEADYLPRVVCCENGAAPSEALKAQAVMARTYVYFRYHDEGLGTVDKPLSGTTADQAYFCNNEVTDACRRAVRLTAEQVMSFPSVDETFERGPETFANVGFFVDGPRPSCVSRRTCACAKPGPEIALTALDHPPGCECFDFGARGGAPSKYVTYNWARAGDKVEATTLGNPGHASNRGCASQNIESCLAYAGWRYHDLLRFFYGQDIELRTAAGVVVPPEAEDGSPVGTPADGPSGRGCAAWPAARGALRRGKARVALVAVAIVVGLGLMWLRRRRAR